MDLNRLAPTRLIVASAMNDLDGVDDQRCDGVEGFDRAFGAAWEIENESCAADGGRTARENRAGSFFQSFAAHFFGESRNHFVGDGLCGFRSDIARAEASAPGGKNQIHCFLVSQTLEDRLNLECIVGNEMR